MTRAFRNIKIGTFIAIVNLLIQGVSFFVQNFIVKNLGSANYGYFGVLQVDFSIFSSIADFGMLTLILAFFGSRAVSGTLFKSILQLRFFCAFATAFVMVCFALLVRRNHPVFWGELALVPGILLQHAFFDWYYICGKFWKKLFISKLLYAISYSTIMAITLLLFKEERIPLIATAMILSAIPTFTYGILQTYNKSIFHLTKRTLHFFFLIIKASTPYAITCFATFAFIPIGLYVADNYASPEFMSAYNIGSKILVLCSGIMGYFISSNLITLHSSKDSFPHIKDIFIFTAFIGICTCPLWLFTPYFLQICFFAVSWDSELLSCSSSILRILSISLLLQAARMDLISCLLKNKHTWYYAVIISLSAIANIAACTLAGKFLPNQYIPLFALSGDLVMTFILWVYFIRNRQIRW